MNPLARNIFLKEFSMAKSLDEELFRRLAHLPRKMHTLFFSGRGEAFARHEGRHHQGTMNGDWHDCAERRGAWGEKPRGGERTYHAPWGNPHGERRRTPFMREWILSILLDSEEGLRQKQIAEQFKVNPSTMSELIDKLESDGYLVRTVDPTDKRATLISLTEKGRARASELEDGRNEYFSQFFTTLTEDEKKELIRLLDKLLARE